MNLRISFTSDSLKFLSINKIAEETIFDLVIKSVHRFQGEDVNVDVKKLKGEWSGFYRIRKGNMRIIAEFDFDNFSVLVERIDWRGSVYKI